MTKKEKFELEKLIATVGEYSDKLIALREGAEQSYKEWCDDNPKSSSHGADGYYKLGFVTQGCKDYAQIIKNAAMRFSEAVKL